MGAEFCRREVGNSKKMVLGLRMSLKCLKHDGEEDQRSNGEMDWDRRG